MTTGGGLAGRLPGLSGVGTTAVVVGGFSGERSRRRRRDCAASQHRSRAAGRRGGHRSLRTLVDHRRQRHAPARHRCTPADQVGRSWHRFL